MIKLKEAKSKFILEEVKGDQDIDSVVFGACQEMVREITLFLPKGEAINTLNHSLILLDKSQD